MEIHIRDIRALEILDSRGDPTVEATVILSDGTEASASVPSGASTGTFEAVELRDGDLKHFGGKGVKQAIANIAGPIRNALLDANPFKQKNIDETLVRIDGTDNKRNLGSNAILAVSLAVARAASISKKIPLYRYVRSLALVTGEISAMPVPIFNVLNGGKHADSNLDFQEFWVIPHGFEKFSDRLEQGSEIFHTLGNMLRQKGFDTDVGNEGGYAPDFESHVQAFDMVYTALRDAEGSSSGNVSMGFDAAASVFFDSGLRKYNMSLEKKDFSGAELAEFMMSLVQHYPIRVLEDPFAEDDWDSWQEFTAKLKLYNPDIRLVGDDLFVTKKNRLARGIQKGVANTILIKPNQVGTLTETIDCISLAREHGYSLVISHRSGETNDSFIADLAVGVSAEYIKAGAPNRGERMAKYNRLLEIESELYGATA